MNQKLFDLRKRTGLSLRAVAKVVGISHTTIMRAERNMADVGYKKIALLLNFYNGLVRK